MICVRLIHKHICGIDKRVFCGIDNRRIFCEIDRSIFCAIIVKPFCGIGYFENWEKQEISYWLRDRGLIFYICVDIIQTSWHGKSMFVSEFCVRCNFLRVGQFLKEYNVISDISNYLMVYIKVCDGMFITQCV